MIAQAEKSGDHQSYYNSFWRGTWMPGSNLMVNHPVVSLKTAQQAHDAVVRTHLLFNILFQLSKCVLMWFYSIIEMHYQVIGNNQRLKKVSLMVTPEERSGDHQSRAIHPLSTVNVCTESHGNPLDSSWDISVWTKMDLPFMEIQL